MGIISSAMLHSWEEMGCLDNDNSEELEQLKTENARLITCLQEIKAIADAKCNECKYGKDRITCKFGDCGEAKLHLITQLITKAESEDNQ